MATIRKRNGKWQAQIRLQGFSPRTATFATKSKAVDWATRETQRLLEGETNGHTDIRQLRGMTLGDLAKEWFKLGGVKKTNTPGYNHLLADPISSLPLSNINRKETSAWRERLLATLKPDSVRRYSRVPRGAWEFGIEVLELPIRGKNPFRSLGLKKVKSKRQRRLASGEYERLLCSCVMRLGRGRERDVDGDSLQDIIKWAVETGMRRGEISRARASHLSEDKRFLFIAETKTDTPRRIPLTKMAQEIALRRISLGHSTRLFPFPASGITRAFTKVVRNAGIEDLRFHDLRHEALSRLNAIGLSVFDMMLISGHTRTESLGVYVHAELERVAEAIGA